jgi:hypothetical protein
MNLMKRRKFVSHIKKLRPKRWQVTQEESFVCKKKTKVLGDDDFDTCEIQSGDELLIIGHEGENIHGALQTLGGDFMYDAVRMVRLSRGKLSKNFERLK